MSSWMLMPRRQPRRRVRQDSREYGIQYPELAAFDRD